MDPEHSDYHDTTHPSDLAMDDNMDFNEDFDALNQPDDPSEEATHSEDATLPREEDDPAEADEFIPKYHFRPQTRESKAAFASTWIDRDTTGNYGDPESPRKARPRRRQVKAKETPSPSEGLDEGLAYDDHTPKVRPPLIAKLKLASEAGKTKYAEFISNLPTEPELKQHDGYRLRKRNAARYNGDCTLDQSPDLRQNLAGHPVARGCRECLGIGLRCSLLDHERAWPCTACFDDEHECELITPPALKRPCERCKRRRGACSYSSSTLDHEKPCQQCMDDGHRCIAGPARDPVNERIRYDRNWAEDPLAKKWVPKPAKRAFASPVDSMFSPSSTTADASPPKIAANDQDGKTQGETHHHHPTKPNLNSPPTKKRPIDPSQEEEEEPTRPPKAPKPSSAAKTKTLTTKFSHPIAFNHTDSPCHFCAEASYAILGLAAREVEVMEREEGGSLEEIRGGHRGEGVECTRVCPECTLQRLQVIMCGRHELEAVDGGVGDGALEELLSLLSGSSSSNRKWCAICPSVAQYECRTPSEGCRGCGLQVCETCMVVLTGMYDGDLQKMLPELKDEPTQERMFGLRADYELLRQDGLLLKHVLGAG